jgi:hypothetical protein
MSLSIKNVGADLEHQGFVSPGRLQQAVQSVGLK